MTLITHPDNEVHDIFAEEDVPKFKQFKDEEEGATEKEDMQFA